MSNYKDAVAWLRKCAETDCAGCFYETQPVEWCSKKMLECVNAIEAGGIERADAESTGQTH